jgi:hypothetical protein
MAADHRAQAREVNAFEFTGARAYRPRVRRIAIAVCFFLLFGLAANAQKVEVLKVLPHYLDQKGRASLSPSLFDRDAYQADLKAEATNRTAIRFDVNWIGRGFDELTLRVEAKGGTPRQPKTLVLEEKVRPGFFSKWSSLSITGEQYKAFGELISWRATLWYGTNQLSEQKSFLW